MYSIVFRVREVQRLSQKVFVPLFFSNMALTASAGIASCKFLAKIAE